MLSCSNFKYILPLSMLSDAFDASFKTLQVTTIQNYGKDAVVLEIMNQKSRNRGCYTGVIIRLIKENGGQDFVGFTIYPKIIYTWDKMFIQKFQRILSKKPKKIVAKYIYHEGAEAGQTRIRFPREGEVIKYIEHEKIKLETLKSIVSPEIFEIIQSKIV